ncbi:MAG: ubiquinone/menaquinone biosynthesis methyltransferase [Planctomycetota bacterium]|nr:ubiquinone/menaquinone biosynthesis methyltransferase [Planctomycetota bacterium]
MGTAALSATAPASDDLRNAGGKSPAEVREMFARVARRYDFLNHLLSLGLDFRWRRIAAREVAGLGASDAVADLCTGTGDLAFAIKRAAPAVKVLALDFTPEMVAYGPKKAQRARLEGVAFGVGDTLRLPLRDGACAASSVGFGIRNVGDLERGLREMARVVRPGGKVLVLEFTKPRGFFFGPLYMCYLKYILPIVAGCIAWVAGDAYRYLPKSIQAFAGPDEMAERMRAIGLKDVRAVPLTFGTVHLYVGVK